jgi:hypothetical protein
MRRVQLSVMGGLALAVGVISAPALAQQAPPTKAIELTPAEIKERDDRKGCKVALCAAFHSKKVEAGAVNCSVLKTWRKEQLEKVVARGGISWPWGNAKCTADMAFKREVLARTQMQPDFEADFGKQQVVCTVEREKDNYVVKLDIQPKVTFKNGKAVKAQLNWGKIDAPWLAKSALWSATAADNQFGVFEKSVVEDINDFLGPKCDEVKPEWQAKSG